MTSILFEQVEKRYEHESDWIDCQYSNLSDVRFNIHIPTSSVTDKWMCDMHALLCPSNRVIHPPSSSCRKWKLFFLNSETSETIFFDQTESRRSKGEFKKALQMKLNMQCRFILFVSYQWKFHAADSSGCFFTIQQLQYKHVENENEFLFLKDRVVKECGVSLSKRCDVSKPTNVKVKAKEHRIYCRYYKMLAMGVPIPAVKQKMSMAGHTFDIERVTADDEMPDEWLKTHEEKEEKVIEANVFEGARLQKVDVQEIEEAKKSATTSFGSKFMITLDQITNALMSLRKVSTMFS